MGTRTITLFDRRPVTIDEDNWPVIAQTSETDRPDVPAEWNREWILKIRREQPGTGSFARTARHLVYGVYKSRWGKEPDRRGGYLIESNNEAHVVQAVWDTVERLGFDKRLGDEVIGDMPAEVL